MNSLGFNMNLREFVFNLQGLTSNHTNFATNL